MQLPARKSARRRNGATLCCAAHAAVTCVLVVVARVPCARARAWPAPGVPELHGEARGVGCGNGHDAEMPQDARRRRRRRRRAGTRHIPWFIELDIEDHGHRHEDTERPRKEMDHTRHLECTR